MDLLALFDSTDPPGMGGDVGDATQGWTTGDSAEVGATLYANPTDGAATSLLHPDIAADLLIS
jgi:hypothetical protein